MVDTEGLFDFSKDQQSDAKLACIVVFMSSYLIYNSGGVFESKDFENLRLTIELNQYVEPASTGFNNFPHFMWVLRDFQSELQNKERKCISPKDYLEQSLMSVSGDNNYTLK